MIIAELKSHIFSLERNIKESETTISNLRKNIYSQTMVIEETSDKLNSELNSLMSENDLLITKNNSLISENELLSNKLSSLNYLYTSVNKQLKELIQQKESIEKSLTEAQLSHLKMCQSIQNEYDSLSEKEPNKFTYIASLMADFLTLKIKNAEDDLRVSKKYHERQRAAKINEIREETKELLTTYKQAQYQLDYLLQMYPELNDVINEDNLLDLSFKEINSNYEMYNDDPVSKYISRAEWEALSSPERNQLALDRYLSRTKTNWEIGRDYELYIAQIYETKGYSVDTFGSYMRINDLGRDLIAKKGDKTLIIQCKYWSTKKEIHENHICQLYGTAICYCIENKLPIDDVIPVFVTSTSLSQKAKEFANMLKIQVIENIPLKDFPRIKCNIGYDGTWKTHIYHLPIDPLYDKVKISKKGEYYCYSVYEAEKLGFRRAYKWHGN